ncbi:hypothetical protein SETIT_2G235300v2 [Setaria italica]|uniref:J domain-containing protein n=1 Tax=Setaria italica TaxID=4555 RepID=A0A368Q479_SETIT|nr:proline-rich extensin-like protein EPR1 [Setaria italica]RCV12030.1 hypothetical protein SETIT_2G235300v2 [Setaria italica]
MDPSGTGASRRKAEQCLSVAEKLLVARDLEGCKQFATQALAADPNTPGADDLHAAAAALLAAQRHRLPSGRPDPYGVLGIDPANPASRRPEAIHSHYRRLSFLLSRSRPDRPCSLAFAEAARLVADAWAFLSDPVLKSALDAELHTAAAARAYHSPAPNLPQPHSQPPLPARPTPPAATPSPRQTPPAAIFSPRPTPPVAAASPWPTPPPVSTPPRPTPPPVSPPPRPTPPPISPPPRRTPPLVASPSRATRRPVAPQTRSAPLPAAPSPVARPTPQPPVASQTQPNLPLPPAPQTPIPATVPAVLSGAAPSSTFWTVCSACCHIHQYDHQYETRKLRCRSCCQTFVAEAMAEPPPIVPGTDMYYCTWGFFPVGFPGCPGFERMANSQPRGPDQLNAPWLGGTDGMKGKTRDNAENGVPPVSAPEVEVPAVTPPAKPMRVKVGAKKRGRPKGSKNKKKL